MARFLQVLEMSSLAYLSSYGNQLSSSIPTSVGRLTSMKNLRLSSNQLTGTLPTSMGAMTALTSLSIGYNLLVGVIPSAFCTLPLQSLYVENSGLVCYSACLSTIGYLSHDDNQGVCTSPPTGNI